MPRMSSGEGEGGIQQSLSNILLSFCLRNLDAEKVLLPKNHGYFSS